MQQSDHRSLSDIRRETEQSRMALTDTVRELQSKVTETADEWKQRASPAAVKAEVSDYIQTRRSEMQNNLIQAAKDNPLQALALGAGVTYPALKMLRAIPAPLLMIGAGIFLTSTKRGQDLSARIQETAIDMVDAASRKVQEAQSAISDTTTSLKSTLHEMADSSMATSKDAIDAVRSGIRGQVEDATHRLTGSAQAMSQSLQDSGQSAASRMSSAPSSLGHMIQANPMMVAGIGLAIGGLIASALPASDAEKKVLGGVSADLQGRARRAVTDTLDSAKAAVVDAVDQIQARAEEQGVTRKSMTDAAEDIGNRVQSVVEKATSAAVGDTQTNSASLEAQS